ncbi:MAG: DUF4234 domain-containing protein [Lachnospiraceae bacterium]|nr:DUF4234 domain-containing protein [Lachnospiraceae bacterium]
MIKNRNIALCIIFSIITCGIYGIYWFITMTNDMNTMAPDDYATTGGMAFLWTLLTCGIYSFYWNYKMGVKLNETEEKDMGVSNGSNHILFLILAIFGLSIINYCIMQSKLNAHATV